MSYELRAAVRSMLLPVVSSREEEFLAEVDSRLAAQGSEEDKASWISLQLRRWKRDGRPTPGFRTFVRELLFLDGRTPTTFMFDNLHGPNGERYLEAAKKSANDFFELHSSLVGRHLFTHDAARQIMSHMGMISRMAIEEGMTSSEISRIITVRDNRFSLNWRAVKAILARMGCDPKLEVADFERIFAEDKAAEPFLFGDLDLKGCIARIGEIADTLGCNGDFSTWLEDLFITQMHAPYLPLLHYQLTIQAEYDHAVTYAYEFNPRGSKGAWMTDRYIDACIPVGKSAVLNNSKATLRFDQVWVAGRDDYLRPATAMARVLEAIENLSALAKDELAAQIRGLLHRYIRIKTEEHNGVLPDRVGDLDALQSSRLLRGIGSANTGTTGILEQRLVDCYGMKQHHDWAVRGMRDSVFAASTFRRKLGDVEFENPLRPSPAIVAYESHGGRLSTPYVLDHIDTFGTVLTLREEELEAIAPLADWTFRVVFVAHEFEAELPLVGNVHGHDVNLEYLTFGDAAEAMCDPGDVMLLNEHLVAPLNNPYVHPRIRQAALKLIQ